MSNTFRVEYTYITESGSRNNTTMVNNASQLGYRPINSEMAILSYLKNRHPNCEVIIRNVEWK